MPRSTTAWAASPAMGRPSNTTAPASGVAMPVKQLNSVVFPAPLGPITATIAPGSTVRLTPSSAVSPPKALVMPRASSTDQAAAAPGRRFGRPRRINPSGRAAIMKTNAAPNASIR